MPRLLNYLFRDLAYALVQMLTGWMPDNPLVCRFRGFLVRPLFKRCGKDLQLGCRVRIMKLHQIEIGNHVYAAEGCWLSGSAPLTIEDEVMFGPRCLIATANHRMKDGSARFAGAQVAPIKIGKGTWLGAQVVVTPGCVIGRGVVVGANSVVTQNVPDGMLAGGIPARVIKPVVESSLVELSTATPAANA